ncbi:MAG: DUF4917 family protein [Chloroflexi bacterium]|nr:DUF4917 family protein [Chloroflexota bacterium]
MNKWEDIKGEYNDCLLLGNGASIAVHSDFEYRSLLNEGLQRKIVTPKVNDVFREFSTSNFEFILNTVWNARRVNRALQIRDRKTSRVYRLLSITHNLNASLGNQIPSCSQIL